MNKSLSRDHYIAFSKFVMRETSESRFSHMDLPESEVLLRIYANIENVKQGYREGVVLVPIEPEGFYSGIVQLKEGDRLEGCYQARKEGEDPRKSTWVVGGSKLPAKSVDIVLYHHDVLAENNEQTYGSQVEWEIISINASPTEEEIPIPVGALIANHLELAGGTATNMTDEEFVAQLRKSVTWWADKSMAG